MLLRRNARSFCIIVHNPSYQLGLLEDAIGPVRDIYVWLAHNRGRLRRFLLGFLQPDLLTEQVDVI